MQRHIRHGEALSTSTPSTRASQRNTDDAQRTREAEASANANYRAAPCCSRVEPQSAARCRCSSLPSLPPDSADPKQLDSATDQSCAWLLAIHATVSQRASEGTQAGSSRTCTSCCSVWRQSDAPPLRGLLLFWSISLHCFAARNGVVGASAVDSSGSCDCQLRSSRLLCVRGSSVQTRSFVLLTPTSELAVSQSPTCRSTRRLPPSVGRSP